MKTATVFMLGLMIMNPGYSAQQLPYGSFDTLRIYLPLYGIIKKGNKVSYTLYGQPVNEEKAKKIIERHRQLQQCKPCYVIYTDSTDKPLREGLFYSGQCPGDGIKEVADPEIDHYQGPVHKTIVVPNCIHGEGIYYDEVPAPVKRTFNYGKQVGGPPHSEKLLVQ